MTDRKIGVLKPEKMVHEQPGKIGENTQTDHPYNGLSDRITRQTNRIPIFIIGPQNQILDLTQDTNSRKKEPEQGHRKGRLSLPNKKEYEDAREHIDPYAAKSYQHRGNTTEIPGKLGPAPGKKGQTKCLESSTKKDRHQTMSDKFMQKGTQTRGEN